jgi:hypothetical protein
MRQLTLQCGVALLLCAFLGCRAGGVEEARYQRVRALVDANQVRCEKLITELETAWSAAGSAAVAAAWHQNPTPETAGSLAAVEIAKARIGELLRALPPADPRTAHLLEAHASGASLCKLGARAEGMSLPELREAHQRIRGELDRLGAWLDVEVRLSPADSRRYLAAEPAIAAAQARAGTTAKRQVAEQERRRAGEARAQEAARPQETRRRAPEEPRAAAAAAAGYQESGRRAVARSIAIRRHEELERAAVDDRRAAQWRQEHGDEVLQALESAREFARALSSAGPRAVIVNACDAFEPVPLAAGAGRLEGTLNAAGQQLAGAKEACAAGQFSTAALRLHTAIELLDQVRGQGAGSS